MVKPRHSPAQEHEPDDPVGQRREVDAVHREQKLGVERLDEHGVEPPVRTISVSSSALGMNRACTIELMISPVATKAKNGSRVQPVPRPISGVKVKTSR